MEQNLKMENGEIKNVNEVEMLYYFKSNFSDILLAILKGLKCPEQFLNMTNTPPLNMMAKNGENISSSNM